MTNVELKTNKAERYKLYLEMYKAYKLAFESENRTDREFLMKHNLEFGFCYWLYNYGIIFGEYIMDSMQYTLPELWEYKPKGKGIGDHWFEAGSIVPRLAILIQVLSDMNEKEVYYAPHTFKL